MFKVCHFVTLTKLVLAVFLVHIGLSIATPLLKSPLYDEICTSLGVTKQLAKSNLLTADTASAQHQHGLDCPLCSPFSNAPLTALAVLYELAQSVSQRADQSAIPRAVFHSELPPLPARGPPLI